MRTELRAHTRWARHDGQTRWTLTLKTPVAPTLLSWLAQNHEIAATQTLPSGDVVLKLRAQPKTLALLMELPKPKGRGSKHECNLVTWH